MSLLHLPLSSAYGLDQVWSAREVHSSGVYLWCVEYGDALLANYVGRTWGIRRTFSVRLQEELDIWFAQRDPRVDRDLFARGIRTFLPAERNTPEELAAEERELKQLYRFVLVPLTSRSEAIRVEGALIRALFDAEATRQFLCSHKDKGAPCSFTYPTTPRIVGLNAPIPQALVDELEAHRATVRSPSCA